MTEPTYDLVIRGGTLATASDTFEADLAHLRREHRRDRPRPAAGRREIDARGKLVLPGGIDSHCHIEQLSAAGMMNADTWESATVSAAHGGTTTVIAFAAQHVGMNLTQVVEDYAGLARKGAVVDYAFHMIVADPTEATVREHLPPLIRAGHASVKVFMTYDRLKVDDEPLLDVLVTARENRALVCVHAENHGMISWMGKRLVQRGYTAPKFHAVSHPRLAESEAFNRLVAMAALLDQPVMIFHVSTAEGAAAVRRARGDGLKVFAETCPQYLLHDGAGPRPAGARGREVDVLAAAARREPTRRRCGGRWRSATCRPSRPITRPTPSTRRASCAPGRARISSRSPTACPASNGACRCSSTPWSRRAGSGSRNSSSSPRPRRPGSTTSRAKARSRSAPTPMSRSGTRKSASRSQTLRSTTAPATRPMPAAPCRAGR